MATRDNSYYEFPKRILREEKKKEGYTLDFGRAIYSYYNSNSNIYINTNTTDRFKKLRSYANGTQSVEKLKDLFAMEKDNVSGERKGYHDLEYKNTPFAPRIVDTIIEILSEKDNYTNVVFLDPKSSDKKKKEKYTMQAKSQLQDFNKGMNELRGIPEQDEGFMPQDKQELDAYEAAGGIRLPLELALETGIDYTFNYDIDWNNATAPYIKNNLIDLAFAGVFTSIDPAIGKISVENIDPERFVIDGSTYYDYRDAQFAGMIRDISILDVYKGYENTMGKKLTEDKLRELAEISTAANDEDYINHTHDKDWYDTPITGELAGFMPARVQVLDFVYLSTDLVEHPIDKSFSQVITHPRKNEIKSGKIKWNGKDYVKVLKNKAKDLESITVWRRGKMIIGTDIVYDLGKVHDQIINNHGVPVKPFSVMRLLSNSIIERNITHFDALQLNAYTIQNLKAQMKPRATLYDLEAISGLKMAGKAFSEQKVIKTHRLGGALFYSSKKKGVHGNEAHSGNPIQELEGGMGQGYTDMLQDNEYHMSQIQINTGLNDVALAQNPNPEVTAAQAQIAQSGANNAIMNVYKAYKKIKTEVAYVIALHLQDEARSGNPYYKDILGEEYYKELASKKNSLSNKEIKIIDSPSEQEKAALYQQMNISLEQGLLQTSDIYEITALLQEGKPLSVIALILKNKENKMRKEQQANAQAASEQNAQSQQQMIALKGEFEKLKQQIKTEGDAAKSSQEFEQDRVLQKEQYQLKGQLAENDDIREKQLFDEPHQNNTNAAVS